MPYVGKKKPGVPTLGVFVPCDPRIDEESRTRAFNIGNMTAAPAEQDGCVSPTGALPISSPAPASSTARRRPMPGPRSSWRPGPEGIFIVPDTWFFPGKTAMALTAHFSPTTPIACVGGNNAPKPGVVGIDALVGAYAQTGRLCPMVIGTMPETGMTPEFDAKTRDEIVDLA